MFESIKTLNFSGASFSESTKFVFFDESKKQHFALIYGKNGTGKSTIAKAFYKLSGHDVPENNYAELFDQTDNPISLPVEKMKRIFVFDEEFINQNIRFKDDGLDTIVMLGDMAECEKQIGELEESVKTLDGDLKKLNKKLEKYNDPNSPLSPQHQLGVVKNQLRSTWAARQKTIKGNTSNSPVTDTIISRIALQIPTLCRDDLLSDYSEKIRVLDEARNSPYPTRELLKIPFSLSNTDDQLQTLLAKRIEKPEFTDREKYLLHLAESGKRDRIIEIKDSFSGSFAFCPFCLQDVSAERKQHLCEVIEQILKKELEEHIADLENCQMKEIQIDFSSYSKIDNDAVNKCIDSLKGLNERIAKYNAAISEKINQPFSPIMLDGINIEEQFKYFGICVEELNKKIQEYNSQIADIGKLEAHLSKINDQLSFYDIKDAYNMYLRQNEELESIERDKDKVTKNRVKYLVMITELKNKQQQITIAVDLINRYLNYVFFSNKRLEICVRNQKYVILSRGQSVKPKDISVGERNILGLCYFFANMYAGLSEKNHYSEETLMVIDDPISSFDHDNRIGIMSLLSLQIKGILLGNYNSRVIVLSHDLQTVYGLSKIGKDICNITKKDGSKKCALICKEITDKILVDFNPEKNEYSWLLNCVYGYANNISNVDSIAIGNIIRRSLEAFSTFIYKVGLDALLSDDTLDTLDEDQRLYFTRRMGKLSLNARSHMEVRVKSLVDINLESEYDEEELKQCARDAICLMYILQPKHIKSYIPDIVTDSTVIDEWCNNCKL